MHAHTRIAVLAALVALPVACADAPEGAEDEGMPEAMMPAEERASDEMAEGLDAADATSVALAVDTLADAGAYLTDGDGRALYLLEGEPENEPTCADACADAWPPYVMTGTLSATPGTGPVDAAMVGTIERADGRTQLTYGGHALYYYAGDTGPGEASGQDVTDEWGEWYLVTPEGAALESHAEDGAQEGATGADGESRTY